jgi:inner membrane protein involved in colicin E2 resistance
MQAISNPLFAFIILQMFYVWYETFMCEHPTFATSSLHCNVCFELSYKKQIQKLQLSTNTWSYSILPSTTMMNVKMTNILMKKIITWLQTQVVFNFLVYNLLHLLSCHLKLQVGVILSSFQILILFSFYLM